MATPEPAGDATVSKAIVDGPKVNGNSPVAVNASEMDDANKGSEEKPVVNGDELHPKEGPNGTTKKDIDADESAPENSATAAALSKPEAVLTAPESRTEDKTDHKAEDKLSESVVDKSPETKRQEDSEAARDVEVEMTDVAPVKSEGEQAKESSPPARNESSPTKSSSPLVDAEPQPAEAAVEGRVTKSTEETVAKPAAEEAESTQPAVDSDMNGEKASPTEAEVAPEDAPDNAKAADASAADTDAVMTDAPVTATTKVSRERDSDDDDEEPLAKRQRTEPTEPVVPTETEQLPSDGSHERSLVDIARWNDESFLAEEITPYRRKEFRRQLGLARKTKAGLNFRDSVGKLWPALAEAYYARIANPMDLGVLDRNLKDPDKYKTVGDMQKDLALVYTNAVEFNGASHDVTRASLGVVDLVWTKCSEFPAEEPPKSKQVKAQPTRHHEPRAAAHSATEAITAMETHTPSSKGNKASTAEKPTPAAKPKPAPAAARRMSNSATSAAEKPADQQPFPLTPNGVPQIRRNSTMNDGERPKRAIHPPKPKDIDYTNKDAIKKNLRPELQFCLEVLNEVMLEKHYHFNAHFLHPVDHVGMGLTDYLQKIKKPMDLGTMKNKLETGEYSTEKQVISDMDLIINNCIKYNGPDAVISHNAKQMRSFFHSEMEKKDAWMAKHGPSKPTSAAQSDVASDDESDAVETRTAADDGELGQMQHAVATLQKNLMDATMKVHEFMAEKLPNKYLIDTQNAVIGVVQTHLLQTKEKLATHIHQKQMMAPKTKPSKTTKAKSGATAGAGKKGGNAGGRKSGGAASAKKAPKREPPPLTELQKNEVAQGVGNLESPYIEQAITIIKKDTNQEENDSGELELDIEQLSQVALRKLYEICCKAIPGFKAATQAQGAAIESPGGSPGPTGAKGGAAGAKSKKKRKPMHKQEQEERIAAIQDKLGHLKKASGGGAADAADESTNAPAAEDEADSSDEDSEEE